MLLNIHLMDFANTIGKTDPEHIRKASQLSHNRYKVRFCKRNMAFDFTFVLIISVLFHVSMVTQAGSCEPLESNQVNILTTMCCLLM